MTPDLIGALPAIVLVAGALVVAALHRISPADERATILLGAVTIIAAGVALSAAPVGATVSGLVVQDTRSISLGVLICAAAALAMLADAPRALASPAPAPALVALALLSTGGALMCAAAGDLLTLFVGLQVVWVPLALASATESSGRAPRGSALVSIAVALLFAAGATLLFLVLGTTQIGALARADDRPARAGIALVFVAIAQSATLAPFMLSRPRARAIAGGHDSIALVVPSLAGFAALVRVGSIAGVNPALTLEWSVTLAVLAAATIVLATLAAGVERSLSGLVAFAMTAQLGIAAAALALGNEEFGGLFAVLASASLATVGASAAISGAGLETRDALRGLGRARPLSTAALALVWLSAAGVPPLLGFAARLAVYEAAARAQLAWLVIIAALASAAWTVIALGLITESLRDGPHRWPAFDAASGTALLVCAVLVVLLGIAPETVFAF